MEEERDEAQTWHMSLYDTPGSLALGLAQWKLLSHSQQLTPRSWYSEFAEIARACFPGHNTSSSGQEPMFC